VAGRGGREASIYTYGASVPGAYIPDLDNAGCILYWGYNLSVAQLAHATSTVAALARGARLVVVDPRRGGLAAKAHHWLDDSIMTGHHHQRALACPVLAPSTNSAAAIRTPVQTGERCRIDNGSGPKGSFVEP
jgi:predicted molibdopterin-dependent oxidoreductase YjgC